MKTVLFACVHNAGRSQMAAALFNRLVDPVRARAISAGTEPGERVHPEVVDALKELGIDLSMVRPTKLTEQLAGSVNLLVTMGCGETCPIVPGVERDDWPLEDPKGKTLAQVRAIRDEIARRVQSLAAGKGWQRSPSGDRATTTLTIEPAQKADESDVRALLLAAQLPVEGLAMSFPAGYAIARRAGVMVGCAGLEIYGRDALLRSVAVTAGERGTGVGVALVRDRLANAESAGLGAVYLLTTTAPNFFRRFGFEPYERANVPPAMQRSAEFAEICPSSAACMRWLAVK